METNTVILTLSRYDELIEKEYDHQERNQSKDAEHLKLVDELKKAQMDFKILEGQKNSIQWSLSNANNELYRLSTRSIWQFMAWRKKMRKINKGS
jgi:hypothetical protein